MKYSFTVWLIGGFLLINEFVFAQEFRRRETNLTDFIQNLFPVQTEGIDYATVYENLYQLYANPLDLNTATRDDLSATYLLTERQLNSFFEYRSQFVGV